MAPPGRPNMTSTPCISRLLMSAWAPVSCMVAFLGAWSGLGLVRAGGLGREGRKLKRPPVREAGERARFVGRALANEYQQVGGGGAFSHGPHIVACPEPVDNPRRPASRRQEQTRRLRYLVRALGRVVTPRRNGGWPPRSPGRPRAGRPGPAGTGR